jgi:hypothetical protein
LRTEVKSRLLKQEQKQLTGEVNKTSEMGCPVTIVPSQASAMSREAFRGQE